MNAKTEFLDFIKDIGEVKCALLEDVYYAKDDKKKYLLKVGHTRQDYNAFLKSIDFQYDEGYGSEELDGTIWFQDGTYADRGEYDGSEWWEYHKTPEIPEELV